MSTRAFEMWLSDARAEALPIVESVNVGSPRSAADAAARLSRLLKPLRVPAELEREVKAGLSRLENPSGKWAVRSSAVGEDSMERSHAGQFTTRLGVRQHDVVDAVRDCWLSAFGATVLAYRMSGGEGLPLPRMAVIVQVLVPGRVSGVLFTANPNGNLGESVIEAGYGLGEGVVSSRVETDRFVRNRFTGRQRRLLSEKRFRVVLSDGSLSTVLEPVPLADQARPSLTEAEVDMLAAWARRAEESFGHLVDMEWTIDANGTIQVLQVRPLTGLPPGEPVLLDNSNVAESYPGITLPLTCSFIREAYRRLFSRSFRRIGVPGRTLRKMEDVFAELLASYRGRIYYNLGNWYAMFGLFPASARFTGVWDRMMGIVGGRPAGPGSAWRRWPAKTLRALAIVWIYLALPKSMARLGRQFDLLEEHFRRELKGCEGAEETLRLYDRITERMLRDWDLTLWNDSLAFITSSLLRGALERVDPLGAAELFNGLLCGDHEMESVRPVRSVIMMAEVLRGAPRLQEAVREISDQKPPPRNPTAALEHRIPQLPEEEHAPAHEWVRRFREHLHRFGERTPQELKLEAESFCDRPDLLLAQVLAYVPLEPDLYQMARREQRIRGEAERSLSNAPARRLPWVWGARLLLGPARRAIRDREFSRLKRGKFFRMIRILVIRLAEEMTQRGQLLQVDDVWYLKLDELRSALDGEMDPKELLNVVQERRREFEAFDRMDAPERIWWKGALPHGEYDAAEATVAVPAAIRGDLRNLRGTPCSAGRAAGRALHVTQPHPEMGSRARILVAPMTDPGWVFLMVPAAGLVVERGGILSHTAIIGRELGIPTIVGAHGAFDAIPDGAWVEMNGSTGDVSWGEPEPGRG